MEWGFTLGLIAITLSVISIVIYFGWKLSKAVQKNASDSVLALHITPTGTILFACMVGFWIICLAARALAPEGSLGAFLKGPDGLLVILIGSVLFCAVAGAVLETLGYPIAKRGGRGA